MAAYVYGAGVDAGAQTRAAVYFASVDTGVIVPTSTRAWVYGARADAGVPLTPLPLADVGITHPATQGVAGALAVIQPSGGTNLYLYGARVDAPYAPPPIFDIPLDPGVSIGQSATHSLASGIAVVEGDGFAFGGVGITQNAQHLLGAALEIYVPSVVPPPVEQPATGGQGGVIVQRNTKTIERVEAKTTVKRIEKPYSDPALVSQVADQGYAVAMLAAQVSGLQAQIASLQAALSAPKPMMPLPPELAARMPIQRAPKVEKVQVQAPFNPYASEQDDIAYVASVLASMK